MARVGFVAKGLLYGTVGAFASCAGLGGGGGTTDSRGALTALHTMPFGDLLLLAIAAGLLGYGVWRIVEGFADPDDRGDGAKGLALRASFIARGLIHLALAVSAARIVTLLPALGQDGGGAGSGDQTRDMTATALDLPGGKWLVLAVGVVVAGFGAWQIVRSIRSKLSRNVDRGDAEREIGTWVITTSRIGIAARGLVVVAAGWLLGYAALRRDASQAGGVERALDVFAGLGRGPLVAIGAGLVAYGIYQLLSARYRRIRV